MSSFKKRKFESIDSKEDSDEDSQKDYLKSNDNLEKKGFNDKSYFNTGNNSYSNIELFYNFKNLVSQVQYLSTNINSLHMKFNNLLTNIEFIKNELKILNKSKKEEKQHTEKYQDLIKDMINLNVKTIETEERKEQNNIKKREEKENVNTEKYKGKNIDTETISEKDLNLNKNLNSSEYISEQQNVDSKSDIEKKIKPEILNMYS